MTAAVKPIIASRRAQALRDALHLQRRDGYPMRAYRCQFCGGHHVGHMPKKNVRDMAQARAARA